MSMKKMLAVAAAAALVAVCAPAFAANPFMDVPMNSWAYDAVDQLHARGVISGYPDGSFKGNKPITRYEMASMVARAMAYMEENNLAAEDMEVLKRLVVEFKDELDALGVRVDDMDARLAKLEDGLGGWKVWGELRFDVFKSDEDHGASDNQEWGMSRYRLWLSKQIDENISFTARIGNQGGSHNNIRNSANMAFDRYYMDVNNFLGGTSLRVGKFLFDWDGDDDMYTDWDTFLTDWSTDGFQIVKDFGMGSFTALAGNNGDLFGARARLNFSEKFWLSLNGLWMSDGAEWDTEVPVDATEPWGDTIKHELYGNLATYWASLGFKFTPAIELKGSYAMQDVSDINMAYTPDNDDPAYWRVIADLDQDALKFTSLWVEYAHFDEGFVTLNCGGFDQYQDTNGITPALYRKSGNGNNIAVNDVDILFVKAEQKWGDSKWSTYERFLNASDGNGDGLDSQEWGIGVAYQYSPNLKFELDYAYQEFDQGNGSITEYEDDNIIRFRTHLRF